MKTTMFQWIVAGGLAVAVGTGCGPSKKNSEGEKQAKAETAAKSGSTPMPSQPAAAPITDLDTDLLKGTAKAEPSAGDKAWQDLQEAIRPPAFPEEWQQKQPTKEEVAAFEKKNGVLAGEAAAKVKDFYTKHPEHEMAARARTMEMGLVNAAVRLGNTNQEVRLRELESAKLKDPNLPEEERFALRAQQLQRTVDGLEENRAASLAAMEKGVRDLQKEFPKREEVSSLLLGVAQGRLENNETDKAREIVQEVLKGKPAGEIKDEAESLQKKLDLVGKPLALKYKAVDGREVDVQAMKGKVVLIDFWATWCGPCMAELPNVKAAYTKLHEKGFEIVGISFDEDKQALEKVIKTEQMKWPQYQDGEGGPKYGDQFGIASIPTMWLVDKKGVLRDLFARENLAEKVEKLLAE